MTVTARSPIYRRRGVLAAVAVAAALATTGSAWLADTGGTTFTISPPAGIQSNNGQAVTMTSMSATFTRPNGNAQLLAGVALERLTIASGYGTDVGFDIAWLDPQDASKVLLNPNAQIYFGFYYPIHTGSCSGTNKSVDATLATITDNSQTFCGELDTTATGSPVISGKLLLSPVQLTGYLQTGVSDATATSTCGGTGSTWCLPSGLGNAASTEVAYLAATIQTPGGKPSGQQATLSSLSFYFAARRH